MIRALWERFSTWATTKALPWAGDVAEEWWLDIGEKPRPHFVSMVAGWLLIETGLYTIRAFL